MVKTCKKIFSTMLSFMVVCAVLLSPAQLFAGTSTSWNFKNSNFKSLGTIKSTTTVDNLTLIATSSKTMSVKSDKRTLDGTTYTHCLALGGTGCSTYRAVKVPVNGNSVIKVTLKSSGSSERSLVVANQSGKTLTNLVAGSSIATKSYNYTGSKGYIYLYSAKSGINIYKIQVDDKTGTNPTTTPTATPKPTTKPTTNPTAKPSSTPSSGSTIVVSSNGTSLASAIAKAKSGTTIIVNGTVKSDAVKLPAGVTLKGQNNGTIDFSQTVSKKARGIEINTNGSTIQDLKIIKAGDNGIFISGNNNTFYNVETAYNKDAGVQVSNGGANNKFYNCYSHHNADAKGENADGFAVKLHSGEGNYFEDCTAEYNSDDGWDLYAAHGAVTFVNCHANYNGECDGIKGDGNGFKLGGVDNKTEGKAAHLDPLQHKLTNCTAKGNLKNGFDRNNQNGVVTMTKCTADSNKGKNFNWPLKGKPSALGYEVTFGKAIINNCTSINGSNNITGATVTGGTGFNK